jgi:hypothetical protein
MPQCPWIRRSHITRRATRALLVKFSGNSVGINKAPLVGTNPPAGSSRTSLTEKFYANLSSHSVRCCLDLVSGSAINSEQGAGPFSS